ncbi:MAG: T3SS effector HopA1 family protein [Solirubrobacteraceae bacterium]|nr:T3SS effector HopA1 family protein [Solirubrobacteraceae bacterium]
MNRYEDQVAAAAGAIELRPPDAFLWFGRREHAGRAGLADAIARRLHDDFFATGTPRPRRVDPVDVPEDAGAFAGALSQANGGRGAWQDAWRVARRDDDGVHVTGPQGLTLVAAPDEVRSEGSRATVRLPRELRGISPGFYVALGDSGTPPDGERAGLYWNIAAAGAATLVARVSFALNRAGVPFTLELPGDPTGFGRGDAALLVIARHDVPAVVKLLRPPMRALGPHLAEPAPAFAKTLARGLALAEQPAGTTRFGVHRCGLLAQAIVAAGGAGPDERVAAVRARFAADGISLDAPYLQPGCSDAYDGS